MERFRNLIIREKVIKVPNQMEALRIFNYPYQAIEEAVVNAFYQRGILLASQQYRKNLRRMAHQERSSLRMKIDGLRE